MDKPRFYLRTMADGNVVIYDRADGYSRVAACIWPVPDKPQGAGAMARMAVDVWNAATKGGQ